MVGEGEAVWAELACVCEAADFCCCCGGSGLAGVPGADVAAFVAASVAVGVGAGAVVVGGTLELLPFLLLSSANNASSSSTPASAGEAGAIKSRGDLTGGTVGGGATTGWPPAPSDGRVFLDAALTGSAATPCGVCVG